MNKDSEEKRIFKKRAKIEIWDNPMYEDYISLDNFTSLGNMILFIRMHLGLTQQELAQKLNVKQNTLSRYENEKRQMSFDIFIKALDILGFEFTIKQKTLSKDDILKLKEKGILKQTKNE